MRGRYPHVYPRQAFPSRPRSGRWTCDVGFSGTVEARHVRVDRANYGNVYVVGDVHGCRETPEALLATLDPAADDLVVFVDHLVRRGPDGAGVVEPVRSTPNPLSVRGTNEGTLVEGRRALPDLTVAGVRWLRSLPLVVSREGHVVVHGGLDVGKPRDRLTVPELRNTEAVADDGWRPHWRERYDGPERVFFGHRVLARPFVGEHAVGLDTGRVRGGPLSACDPDADRVVRVRPTRAHRERAPEKLPAPDPDPGPESEAGPASD